VWYYIIQPTAVSVKGITLMTIHMTTTLLLLYVMDKLIINLVNNELDAQFLMHLFHFSTCFEQPHAHNQENPFYQYNIWYMSLCVGDRLVCRSERNFPTCTIDGHLRRVTYYTRCCIDTIDSPDDEHGVARNM
jgi:hypothetical protein